MKNLPFHRVLISGLLLNLCVLGSVSRAARPNIIFILSDDHRYDFLSCHPNAPDFLETPNLDRLAREGAHLVNAFVSTSLCSPSRATILTGQYMHHHRVVDNQRPVPAGTRFFPEYLQKEGYQTGFVGKWHMGHDNDEARPGFDHWVSFKGQGVYQNPELNVNGNRSVHEGYSADIFASLALEWLGSMKKENPYFLYLSFKAPHYPFQPAPRNQGRYRGKPIDYPETMALTEENYQTQSRWIRERRYGIHGIDHMQTGALDKDPVPDFDQLYYNFCEAVFGIDENVGRVLQWLDTTGTAENTWVFYMGDNGFALGEHGFYDKRDAFEESIRVPLLVRGPGITSPGLTPEQMIMNLDIAPTILEIAGTKLPADAPAMDGTSFLPILKGQGTAWRNHLLYEYHWEWNFPATPTTLAIRTDRYKYIYYHGIWDRNGLYDLGTDPHERHNLIDIPAFRDLAKSLEVQLFTELEASGGLNLPIRPPKGDPFQDRKLQR